MVTTWNYRLMRVRDVLCIGEVYKENGKVVGYVEGPLSPMGETFEEILNDLRLMHLALQKPIFVPEADLEPSMTLDQLLELIEEPKDEKITYEDQFPRGKTNNFTWGIGLKRRFKKRA